MWGPKRTPTSFSPVTFTNVRISPQNFLTSSFNPFANTGVKCQGTWCQSQIIDFKPKHASKKFSGQILIKLRL